VVFLYLTRSKLAKRKAEELEDFGTGRCDCNPGVVPKFNHSFLPEQAPSQESQFSPDVIENGVQIVEELLKTWASQTPSAAQDEDVVMSDDLSPEAQLAELKNCFSAYQERIDSNPWVQSLLASL
jgi:DNA mismatch repair protein MSH2